MTIDLSVSLVGLAALITSAVAAYKYYKDNKNDRTKGLFFKAFKNTTLISREIFKTHRELGVGDLIGINVMEVTNNGGYPRPLHPVFMKCIDSTNPDAIDEMGQEKVEVDRASYPGYFQLGEKGYFSINTEDLTNPLYQEYNFSKNIQSTVIIWVKEMTEQKRLILLTADFKCLKEDVSNKAIRELCELGRDIKRLL